MWGGYTRESLPDPTRHEHGPAKVISDKRELWACVLRVRRTPLPRNVLRPTAPLTKDPPSGPLMRVGERPAHTWSESCDDVEDSAVDVNCAASAAPCRRHAHAALCACGCVGVARDRTVDDPAATRGRTRRRLPRQQPGTACLAWRASRGGAARPTPRAQRPLTRSPPCRRCHARARRAPPTARSAASLACWSASSARRARGPRARRTGGRADAGAVRWGGEGRGA